MWPVALLHGLWPVPCSHLQVRNEKARRFLASMRKKPGVDLAAYFPRADAGALALLRRLLAFDPADRPSAEEALADPYFHNLHSPAREPSAQVWHLGLHSPWVEGGSSLWFVHGYGQISRQSQLGPTHRRVFYAGTLTGVVWLCPWRVWCARRPSPSWRLTLSAASWQLRRCGS